MSPQLNSIINEVRELTPAEQVKLISEISQLLQNTYTKIDSGNNFWNMKSIDELIKEQSVSKIENVLDSTANFWPEDESADDFNEYINKQRQEDRIGN